MAELDDGQRQILSPPTAIARAATHCILDCDGVLKDISIHFPCDVRIDFFIRLHSHDSPPAEAHRAPRRQEDCNGSACKELPIGLRALSCHPMSEDAQDSITPLAAHRYKNALSIKTLQPTPSRFALGVARTSYPQLITSSPRSPVRGG